MSAVKFLAAAAIAACAMPASAIDFDFYKLGRISGDFLPSDGVACTGGDLCSSNVMGGTFDGDLSYTNGGLIATATGTYQGNAAAVVQDHEPNWTLNTSAGLGVYHIKPVDNSDDNVTTGEALTITFNQQVSLSSIALRAEGHNIINWDTNATFALRVDGSVPNSMLLPTNVGYLNFATALTGTSFTFAYGGKLPDQFYLASMSVTPVPEPDAYGMALAGMGVVGFMLRRRKQQA